MSTLKNVYELELLSRISLVGVERRSWRRVAYYAGLVTGLRIAQKMAEEDVTFVDARLRPWLDGIYHPTPEIVELARMINKHTSPRVYVDLTIFEETGLRHGDPGAYYSAGMRNAMLVGFEQAPSVFEFISEQPNRELVIWLSEKIEWAEMKLFEEKSKM